jgi:hypothetical protein
VQPPKPLPVSADAKCAEGIDSWGTGSSYQLANFRFKFPQPWLCNESRPLSFKLAQSAAKAMRTADFRTGVVEVSVVDPDSIKPIDKVPAQELIDRANHRQQEAAKSSQSGIKHLKYFKPSDKLDDQPLRSGGGASDTVAAWTWYSDQEEFGLNTNHSYLDILVLRDGDRNGLTDGWLHLKITTGDRTKGDLAANHRLALAVLATIRPPVH